MYEYLPFVVIKHEMKLDHSAFQHPVVFTATLSCSAGMAWQYLDTCDCIRYKKQHRALDFS